MNHEACIIPLLLLSSTLIFAGENQTVIGHWSFDDANPAVLTDRGPNGLNAHQAGKDGNTGISFPDGRVKQAIEFAPQARAKYTAAGEALNLNSSFTISCWVWRSSEKPVIMSLVSKKFDSSPNGYELRLVGDRLRFTWGDGKETKELITPRNMLQKEQWYQVAVTYDGQKLRLFINFQPVMEKDLPDLVIKPNKTAVVIGNYPGKADSYNLIGKLDEVHIAGKALSAEEMFQVMAPAAE